MDRIADPWGEPTPYGPVRETGEGWPERIDEYLDPNVDPASVERWVQAASLLHSNGDAMDIAVRGGRMVGVRGRGVDRVNRGRLGPKDLFGWQANHAEDRLKHPLVRKNGELVEASWDEAMGRIVDRSRELLAEPGGQLKIGFYTSGQLFLEEYYTLAVIGKAGIGTPHMDANTRLCTATAAAAFRESFGADGQPGSYEDIDDADTIVLYGHNVAETQPVLWMRMRDRLEGANPPKLIVVDPRPTVPARRADVHLPVRNGTNLALMNAIQHELIANDWIEHDYIAAHTTGFDELSTALSDATPEWAAEICDVPVASIREAARLIGTSKYLVSTVLQGFYQSHQATASACQVNNIHLLRGMIGQPGRGLLQMNGQPSSQNTRETGAGGTVPGFRNWENPMHVAELADMWEVDPLIIPHWAEPTHSMEIFRYAEEGSIKLLWISCTNPAVSMPHLERLRKMVTHDDLTLVVQDIFFTETCAFADVVLPAATWGEKTGTFTNTDRTVHFCGKAVEPPGEARPDLDIFLDYARRMDFRTGGGKPLIDWHDPESAFEAWKRCSRGRPCDYSGLSYERLQEGSGIQWPCTEDRPDGTPRLYTDGIFPTDPEECELFGHDLETGAAFTPEEYRAKVNPGRAFLRPASYRPPDEIPDADYPFSLTTGRTVYHFHTRTKTGRVPELNSAAPDFWIELSAADASSLEIGEGDIARVESRRGDIEGPVRITGIREGVVFAPFHYGSNEHQTSPAGSTAANELTWMEWDPVSKQPYFKIGAVRVTKVAAATGSAPAPAVGASAQSDERGEA